MKQLILLGSFLIFSTNLYSTTFTTTADGSWGSTATWGGIYVSSFMVPPSLPNWFTSGSGDTIIINHQVTMDYNIFVRNPDILVIGASGSLSKTSNFESLYNLSAGNGAYQISGIIAGLFIQGQLNVGYFRNNSVMDIEPSGVINLNNPAPSGGVENFGDLHIQGKLLQDASANEFIHNAGDLWYYANSLHQIEGAGKFDNKSVIRSLPASACIFSGGDFNNLVGAVVIGTGGTITTVGNIDNSTNPMTHWSGAKWCAGTGINLPSALEDCSSLCNMILPVELISFRAVSQNHSITLNWEVSTEQNLEIYEIEHSFNGIDFETIGRQLPFNTNGIQNYWFIDKQFKADQNYYRLKIIDRDRSYEYSNIVAVCNKVEELSLNFYPNPVSDQLIIQHSSEQIITNCLIRNQFGQILFQSSPFQMQDFKILVEVSQWPNGIYYIEYFDAKLAETVMLKFVKQ